jgi:DNA-binding transcriptional regulator YhcF (GntR family)
MKLPLPVRRPFAFRLDMHTGVPLYRQLIDQVQAAIAAGLLVPGDQLPTVRQVAVDLEINPNTVMRAYREMEIRGILDTQQGTGTFVAQKTIDRDALEHARGLEQLVEEFAARAGAGGFKLEELMTALSDRVADGKQPRTFKPKGDKR